MMKLFSKPVVFLPPLLPPFSFFLSFFSSWYSSLPLKKRWWSSSEQLFAFAPFSPSYESGSSFLFSSLSLPLPVSPFALVVVPAAPSGGRALFRSSTRDAATPKARQGKCTRRLAITIDVRSSAGPFVLVRVKGCLFVRPTTSESTSVRPSCKQLFIITWAIDIRYKY
jgi:hypothetical protein